MGPSTDWQCRLTDTHHVCLDSRSIQPRSICALDDVIACNPTISAFHRQVDAELSKKSPQKLSAGLLGNDADWQQKWWLKFQRVRKLAASDVIYAPQDLDNIWKMSQPDSDQGDSAATIPVRSAKGDLVSLALKVAKGKIESRVKVSKLQKGRSKSSKKKQLELVGLSGGQFPSIARPNEVRTTAVPTSRMMAPLRRSPASSSVSHSSLRAKYESRVLGTPTVGHADRADGAADTHGSGRSSAVSAAISGVSKQRRQNSAKERTW
eukprot:GHVS01102735.1.p1 GENE.GHVS01102735.1~~GHVS01102735.1.p1  ORF type:complete len:265 (+),score=16.50 GHVS01102735.1:61-855(+)